MYQQLTLGLNDSSSDLGALLYLFGGVAPVAVVASVALVRGEGRTGLPSLLVGAVAAWSLTWIGVLLRLGTFAGASWEVGFWLQAVSIGVAVIGTILVGLGRRSEVKDSHDRYANEEGVDRPIFSQESWSPFAGSPSPKQGADQSNSGSTFLGTLTSPPVARVGSGSSIPQVGSIEPQSWRSGGASEAWTHPCSPQAGRDGQASKRAPR